MDLQYSDRSVHVPQEIVNHVASQLRKASDIAAARLVNRAFCRAATELITDITSSPAAIFTSPTDAELEEVERAKPFTWFGRQVQNPLTIWTWLQIPIDIGLEDRLTRLGRTFLELAIAPSTMTCLASLDDEEDDDGKDEVPQSSGRKATCWGRMQERQQLFCIIMREFHSSRQSEAYSSRYQEWHSRAHWNAYRLSHEASVLIEFLGDVAPGCVATSFSEEVPFPPEHKQHRPLFEGLCKIRTVYFNSSMTAEQKSQVEGTQYVRHFSVSLSELKVLSIDEEIHLQDKR